LLIDSTTEPEEAVESFHVPAAVALNRIQRTGRRSEFRTNRTARSSGRSLQGAATRPLGTGPVLAQRSSSSSAETAQRTRCPAACHSGPILRPFDINALQSRRSRADRNPLFLVACDN
jgi:hypothetical protein